MFSVVTLTQACESWIINYTLRQFSSVTCCWRVVFLWIYKNFEIGTTKESYDVEFRKLVIECLRLIFLTVRQLARRKNCQEKAHSKK